MEKNRQSDIMSVIKNLKEQLKLGKERSSVQTSGVISRTGAAIVWDIDDETKVETLATLSATVYGAAEVIYASMGKTSPDRIKIESTDGVFIVAPVGSKALLVAGIDDPSKEGELTGGADQMVNGIKEVLANEKSELQ